MLAHNLTPRLISEAIFNDLLPLLGAGLTRNYKSENPGQKPLSDRHKVYRPFRARKNLHLLSPNKTIRL